MAELHERLEELLSAHREVTRPMICGAGVSAIDDVRRSPRPWWL